MAAASAGILPASRQEGDPGTDAGAGQCAGPEARVAHPVFARRSCTGRTVQRQGSTLLATPRSSRFRRRWPLVVVLIAVALGGYFGWRHFYASGAGAASAGATKTGGPAQAAVPVTLVAVQTADFPVYLYGLGTVEPYDTVTVQSRVDGEVTKVDFKQGQMVKEGDILAEIDPRPYQAVLDQAQARKVQDEASLKDAMLNLQRYNTLAKQDFASRQQLDTQQAKVNQLAAQIKGDQAMIDSAQTQVTYTTIRAPLAGKTGFRLVDPGNVVHAAGTTGIVTIVKLQPISVVFTAPEEDVPQINKALAAETVPVDALSSDGLKTLSRGRLALVNNEVNQASGTISMKATFANTDDALWPGLSVATRLLVDTLKQATVVPTDAVQHGPNGLYVFVAGDDNKVALQTIKVGQEGDGQSVVLQGVSGGQKVVVAGQYRLQQGTLVQPAEANAPATPEKTAETASVKAP
jgi:multidrug efflux system membrane fusion protein